MSFKDRDMLSARVINMLQGPPEVGQGASDIMSTIISISQL